MLKEKNVEKVNINFNEF